MTTDNHTQAMTTLPLLKQRVGYFFSTATYNKQLNAAPYIGGVDGKSFAHCHRKRPCQPSHALVNS